MLKVATYNIKNKTADKILGSNKVQLRKFKQNIDLIKQVSPDIIGLQEVTMKEYEWLRECFEDSYEIYGNFRGSVGITNEACPIMIKKDIGYVTDYSTFSISNDINKVGKKYFGAFFPRIVTCIRFADDFDEYSIMNMHVDNSKFIQKKTFDIDGPIEQILCEHGLDNQIIMGDMNTGITGPLKDFCYRNFLRDAALPLGNTYRPLNMALDHILYADSQMSAYNVKQFSNDGSDHSLIMTEIHTKRS